MKVPMSSCILSTLNSKLCFSLHPSLQLAILFDSSSTSAIPMNENIVRILGCKQSSHSRMPTHFFIIFSFIWNADIVLESNKIVTRKIGSNTARILECEELIFVISGVPEDLWCAKSKSLFIFY
jgi:hypothetical protein